MTDDIVDRLRWWKGEIGELFEAADEIERLRAENERLRAALRSVFEAKASIATGITFRDDGAANLWLSMWTEAAAAISTTPASEGASND